jgi:hypothetical protein
MIYNAGAAAVAIGYGLSAASATANAVFPTAGNPKPSIVIPAGAILTFTLTGNLFFSGIIGAGTASVYITPGDGV